MNLQNTPTYYIKDRKEVNEDKALRQLINEEGVTGVAAIEQGIAKMRRIKMEHCFGNEETHETRIGRKTPRWLLFTFKERRRNYMKEKIYLEQLLLKDTFAAKR